MGAQHEELIAALVAKSRPVAALPPVRTRLAVWLLLALTSGAGIILAVGPRGDAVAALFMPTVAAHSLLLGLAAALAAWSALRLAVPGTPGRGTGVAAGGVGAGWLLTLGLEGAVTAPASTPAAWGCAFLVLGAAIGPGFALGRMVHRGAPLDARAALLVTVLAAVAFGALVAEWTCSNAHAAHLIWWHAAPLVGAVVLAAAVRPAPTL